MMQHTSMLRPLLLSLSGVFLLAGVACATPAAQPATTDNQPPAILSEIEDHTGQLGEAPAVEEAEETDVHDDTDTEALEPAKQFDALLERYLSDSEDEPSD